MPDLGDKPHLGRAKRILGGDLDVNLVLSSLVRCIGRAMKDAPEVGKVGNVGAALGVGDGYARL